MASCAQRGVTALESELGDEAAERVERVDVDKDGRLVYTVEAETGEGAGAAGPAPTRWFRFDGESLRELQPRDDHKLPWCDPSLLGSETDARILSWRPGRRITLVRRSDGLIVKAYRKGRARQPVEHLKRARVEDEGGEVFRVPRVVAFDESTSSLTMEALPGTPPTIRPADADLFFGLGSTLARWQRAVESAGLAEHGVADELAVLDERARRFELVTEQLPQGWTEARELCAALATRIAPSPARPAHRDLHDGQLVVGDSGLGLLDFDLLCAADPVLDLANLSVHLRLRALQGLSQASDEGAEACAHALHEGFGDAREPADPDAFAFYEAATFLRLALVYGLRPRWAHLVHPLIEGERARS